MRFLIHLTLILTGLGQVSLQAILPEISKQELLDAVISGDQQIQNYQADFDIEETFMPDFDRKYPTPKQRLLNMRFTKESEKYFYDIRVKAPEDQWSEFPEWSYKDAFNGQIRTQFNPVNQFGDVFANPFSHAFPIPQDFGLSLGSRDKNLGEDLSQSEIHSIEPVTHNGHQCYHVVATKAQGKSVEVWIDPAIGFRTRAMTLFNINGGRSYEVEAEFTQNSEGIWFPTSGTARLYGNNNQGERAVSTLRKLSVREVEINNELTTEDLTIDFPPGSKVFDHIVGIGYEVGVTSIEGVLEDQLDAVALAAKNNHFVQAPPPATIDRKTVPEKVIPSETATTIAENFETPVSLDLKKKQKGPLFLITVATIAAAVIILILVKRRA